VREAAHAPPPASETPNAVPPSGPTASFAWFPTAPHTGETISLVSSSTDTDSPIVTLAWDLTGNGAFTGSGPVIHTSFKTPGRHVVRLRATDANGLANVATETIVVTSPPLVLMQPFPIVRIAGSLTASGVQLTLLRVQAPVGARVTVRCRGRSCPVKSISRVATLRRPHRSTTGTVLVGFPRFQRSLRAGVVLEIRVYKPGQVGKYTRFSIRHGKPPGRVDECVAAAALKPIACPAS
jgi:hypothetical protein